MLTLFLSPAYAPFSVAFAIMLGIGVVQAIGIDADSHGDLDGGVLDWLGLDGDLPLLVWLIALLACFTTAGVALQQLSSAILGAPIGGLIASAVALPVALVANAFVCRGLARILPGFETSVVSSDDLVRLRGTVLEGVAQRGHPARAKVVDRHGQAHFVMIEPHDDAVEIRQGETALLVRRQGTTFFVLPDKASTLQPL